MPGRVLDADTGQRALDSWPRALDAVAGPRALDAGPRALDAVAGPRALEAAGCQCRAERAGCRAAHAGPRALDAGPRALRAGPRSLDARTIWQNIQRYIGAFWAANAAKNAGNSSTPAYGGTAAATTLCPTCVTVATILKKPQQHLPGRRARKARNIVDYIVRHWKHCISRRSNTYSKSKLQHC